MTDESPPPRIEFFSRKRRKTLERTYYFRFRAANSQIICSSQGYSRRVDAVRTAVHLRERAIEARMYDMDSGEEVT